MEKYVNYSEINIKTCCDSIYLIERQLWQKVRHPTGDQQT